MLKIATFSVSALVATGACGIVSAYEVGTHARITEHAYLRSRLNTDTSLLINTGLYAYTSQNSANPFGNIYYDIHDGNPRIRQASNYATKGRRMPDPGANSLTLKGWLMRGAIREDDIPKPLGMNPQDVPPPDVAIYRVFHHFYDPVNQQPLNDFPFGTEGFFRSLAGGELRTAANWASGSIDAFHSPNIEDTNRLNHFTIYDAHEALWRALTSQDRNGNPDIGPNGQRSDESVRKAYWATVFRTMGDVVHLVQDMGQPQHTRNETHSPLEGYSKTVYEAYTEMRATGDSFACYNGTPGGTFSPLPYDGYPIPSFTQYSEFFSTVPTDVAGILNTGRGLADYSNRGFFTAGNNLNTTNYSLPEPNPSSYSTNQANFTDPCIPAGSYKTVLNGVVADTVTGAFDIAPLSATGLWNLPTHPATQQVRYTLNEDIYKKMGDLLAPRAVAYSAGLINYFFRGRLDILLESYNRTDVTLRFKNETEEDTLYSQDGTGQLIVTYRYTDDKGQEIFGTSDIVNLASGDDVVPDELSETYTFTFSPEIPVAAKDLELRLIFRGRLGNESDAIALGYKPMTSPGFIVQPSQLPADGISGPRHIYKEDGIWKLGTESGLVTGNVDWKGHDPDDVLSFDGPQSRYFYASNRKGYSRSIYRRGHLLAQVPVGFVQGVGIRAVEGVRYLTAVSYGGAYMLFVYSREFADSYPNDDAYDAVSNPLGWKEIGAFDTSSLGFVTTPFFMNASGTEAQGLFGKDGVNAYRYETRIKLAINGETVTRTDYENKGSYVATVDDARSFDPSFTVRTGSIDYETGSCPFPLPDCLATCPNGGCSHYQTDVSEHYEEKIRHTYQFSSSDQKVVATDYAGDREVLGIFEYSGVANSSNEEASNDSTYYMDSRSDCVSSSTYQQTDTSNLTYKLNEKSTGYRRITAGSTLVTIDSNSVTTSFNITDSVVTNRDDNTIDSGRTYTVSGDTTSDNEDSKLIFMDLRYNDVVYSASGSTSSNHYTTAGGDQDADLPNDFRYTTDQISQRNYAQYSNVVGNLFPLHTWVGATNDYTTANNKRIWTGCRSYVDNKQTVTTSDYPTGDAWSFMHVEAVKGLNTRSRQGYARDAYGNLFTSQTIWEQQIPPPSGDYSPQPIGWWNYLTDGNPVALFGLTGSDPHFTKVGLY